MERLFGEAEESLFFVLFCLNNQPCISHLSMSNVITKIVLHGTNQTSICLCHVFHHVDSCILPEMPTACLHHVHIAGGAVLGHGGLLGGVHEL